MKCTVSAKNIYIIRIYEGKNTVWWLRLSLRNSAFCSTPQWDTKAVLSLLGTKCCSDCWTSSNTLSSPAFALEIRQSHGQQHSSSDDHVCSGEKAWRIRPSHSRFLFSFFAQLLSLLSACSTHSAWMPLRRECLKMCYVRIEQLLRPFVTRNGQFHNPFWHHSWIRLGNARGSNFTSTLQSSRFL